MKGVCEQQQWLFHRNNITYVAYVFVYYPYHDGYVKLINSNRELVQVVPKSIFLGVWQSIKINIHANSHRRPAKFHFQNVNVP